MTKLSFLVYLAEFVERRFVPEYVSTKRAGRTPDFSVEYPLTRAQADWLQVRYAVAFVASSKASSEGIYAGTCNEVLRRSRCQELD